MRRNWRDTCFEVLREDETMSIAARSLIPAVFAGLVAVGPVSAAPITIGGFAFDGESAFADDATYLSGETVYIFHPPGTDWTSAPGNSTTDLDAYLTGSDITNGVDGGGITFDLDFIDNAIVNGAGDDLVVFETIAAESFDLALFDGGLTPFMTFTPIFTGTTVGAEVGSTNTGNLNAAAIDLSDFGIAAGATISSLRIRTVVGGGSVPGSLAGADIVAIGALNSRAVPEPSTFALLAAGLLAVYRATRR